MDLWDKTKDVRFLVVGDVMLDRFVRGGVQRISPEAPVPIVEVERVTEHPGGAANVARNLAEFTTHVSLLGQVGQDESGQSLRKLLESKGIGTEYLVAMDQKPTATKTRVVAGHQQVVRFDAEKTDMLDGEDEQLVLEALERASSNFDCVIVEDYAKGLLTPAIISRLKEMVEQKVRVMVDPNPRHQADWSGLTAVKPNLFEACQATGMQVQLRRDSNPAEHSGLRELTRRLMEKWSPQHLLLTIGEHGMIYADQAGKLVNLPAQAREVYDVSGAGDTAIAVFGLLLGAGIDGEKAAYWANQAASLVVGKLGTATVSLEELRELG